MLLPRLRRAALSGALALCASPSLAQDGGQNEANNPLTPKITVNAHNYYVGDLSGLPDEDANQFLVRGLVPHKVGGPGQLLRFTLPVATSPTASGHVTDWGDLTLIDLFPFKAGRTEVAVGPLLVAPTATNRATGAGKWQVGAAGLVIAPQTWGLVGSLVTYQASVAGSDTRSDVSLMTMQPLLLYNLPKGWYLRSTAIWNFDFEGDNSYVPVGFGVGKVIPTSGPTVNVFVEPQVTAWKDDGVGVPNWQVFVGVNLQFPIGGKR